MEHYLLCNNLKCRGELSREALVTICSHIFCLGCARDLGLSGERPHNKLVCPACRSVLDKPDDAIISNLNPSENFKTSVLSGLGPNTIMECAGRALSFWAYQTTQDIYYQQHLCRSLGEKYADLRTQLDRAVTNARSDIEGLQKQVEDLYAEQRVMRRKNEDLAQAYREKERKLMQTQELYDKVKRRAELGNIQRAALDAVNASMLEIPNGGSSMLASQDHASNEAFGEHHFESGGLRTGLLRPTQRSAIDRDQENRPAHSPRGEDSVAFGAPLRHGPGPSHYSARPSAPGEFGRAHAPTLTAGALSNTVSDVDFRTVRGRAAALGLIPGLRVSQPTGLNGLKSWDQHA